ncbi:hypothetical protein OUZ56_030765 [Daphnia magna]|nr:hypothetical protein OUZ56_030765 [Daphnia magna]
MCLLKMHQQPATRGWVRKDCLARGLKFPKDLSKGQQVYAKHPESGNYCLGHVMDNSKTVTYYSIEYNEGASSQDTYPEDIHNYNCIQDGPPPIGAAVEFFCHGKRVTGYLRGILERQLYELCFRDGEGTIVIAEREEFYHPDEELPGGFEKAQAIKFIPERTD